jgi:hypothetical protein
MQEAAGVGAEQILELQLLEAVNLLVALLVLMARVAQQILARAAAARQMEELVVTADRE